MSDRFDEQASQIGDAVQASTWTEVDVMAAVLRAADENARTILAAPPQVAAPSEPAPATPDPIRVAAESAMHTLLHVDADMGERKEAAKAIADAIRHPWPPSPDAPLSARQWHTLFNEASESILPLVAAADAAAAAADALYRLFRWSWWYMRPWYVLRRHARALLAGWPEERNAFAPLVALYKMGCCPIGFVEGAFTVWCPPSAGGEGK